MYKANSHKQERPPGKFLKLDTDALMSSQVKPGYKAWIIHTFYTHLACVKGRLNFIGIEDDLHQYWRRNSYLNVTGDMFLSLFIHRFLYYRRWKPDVAQGLHLKVAAKPARQLDMFKFPVFAHSPCPLPLWGLAWCWYTSWPLWRQPWSPTSRQRSSLVARSEDFPPYLSASSWPYGTLSPPPAPAAWRFAVFAPPRASPAHAPRQCVCTFFSYNSAPCTPSPPPSNSAHRAGRERTFRAASAVSLRPGSWGWPWRRTVNGQRRTPCGLHRSRHKCWLCPRESGSCTGDPGGWGETALACSRGRCSGFPRHWSLLEAHGQRTRGPQGDGWTEPSGSAHPGKWTAKAFNIRAATHRYRCLQSYLDRLGLRDLCEDAIEATVIADGQIAEVVVGVADDRHGSIWKARCSRLGSSDLEI